MSDNTVIERTEETVVRSTPPSIQEAFTKLVQWVTERHVEDDGLQAIFDQIRGLGWSADQVTAALLQALPDQLHAQVHTLANCDDTTASQESDGSDGASNALFNELVAWVAQTSQEGYAPAQIFNWMCANQWSIEDAVAALLQALPPEQHGNVHMLARLAPDPDYSRTTNSLVTINGHTVRVLCELRNPRVVVFSNLLTLKECKELIAPARSRLERSTVTGDGTEELVSTVRTSSGMFYERSETPLCARIEARIAKLLDWPTQYTERMQVLCYGQEQQYEPHYDYFEPPEGPWAPVFSDGGQRVGSLVIYLNTPAQGGSTVFPDIPLEVHAVAGNAVFFAYDKADPSSRTLHGGAPVGEGEKWVAVNWFRQGPTA